MNKSIEQLRAEGKTWDEIMTLFENSMDAVMDQEEKENAAEADRLQKESQVAAARKDMCDAIIIYLETLGHKDLADKRDNLENMFINVEDILKDLAIETDGNKIKVSGVSRFRIPGFGFGWF